MVDGMSIIERREPNELHACRTCGTDIAAELDASYEYGYRRGYEKRASYEPQLEGAVKLLDALDRYVGHREDCNALSGAPECSCGFDDLYARVRAAVRGQ